MAINIVSAAHSSSKEEVVVEEEEEEDYIDLEVSSYSIFHCDSFTSPPPPQFTSNNIREFEFHMSSSSLEREQPLTSPADELFYKGKLLPLHLPPRLQMVEKLLENSNKHDSRNTGEELYSTPLMTSPSTPVGVYSTPFESCNVSPSESCTVSRELNPSEYFFEYLEDEIRSENPKKSWGKKIKLIKQSLLGSKLKTPKTYLKSLFGKYSCSHESSANNIEQSAAIISTNKDSINGKLIKTNPNLSSSVDVMRSFHKESEAEKVQQQRRRSLSGLSKRHPSNETSVFSSSCSSSSLSSDSSLSSNDSNGFNQPRLLKRSNSRNSEMESPIQGAIKHCKQSQHLGKSIAVFPESV
ncbi:probable membrane-associated kinase regulator 4 [Punica granatum]|uniref:Uncharacterized protein n=2 Tax=Punica granatum TaxID=22663 RepID=A0A218WD34_PUNGR|nr:probable membrane-associated kinase regulator 4 [Punica granatum]OWM70111.1 hypothetical protein CDL15_Pgr025961 [Punica granatum]PKI35206.1 hypothetical protein CRG98_044372 [Punica granatum]